MAWHTGDVAVRALWVHCLSYRHQQLRRYLREHWRYELYSPQPSLWHNGQLQLLDLLGLPNGVSYDINDHGVAVGEVDGGVAGPISAVMWSNGRATILSGSSIALAINNAGQVLLTGPTGSSIWSSGTITPITGPADAQYFVARRINDAGHVVGDFGYTHDTLHIYGFFWNNGSRQPRCRISLVIAYGFPDRHQ